MTVVWVLLCLAVQVNSQCHPCRCVGGGGGGGGGGYGMSYEQAIRQPVPQYLTPQELPQPQSPDYYYKVMNTYSKPPPVEVLPSSTKEIVTVSLPSKSVEYDDYEKKRTELKPEETTIAYENPIKPSTTYIREMEYQPYPQRPVPYRPHLPLPPGRPVISPQYYRLAPYMPRGHMLPYAPTSSYSVAPSQTYQQPPHYMMQSQRHQQPLNDCCGRCSAVCGPHTRRIFAKSAKTVTSKESDTTTGINETDLNDSRCTSKELKDIMEKISYRTPSLAKRLIQRTAEKNLGGFFSVFCSKDDFTYVSRSETYCQTENEGVLCYAFQHS